MTLNAHILNGSIVLDEPHPLPEGAAVQVVLSGSLPVDPQDNLEPPTLLERLAPVIGTAAGLPSDFSLNHDHYLYGVPKKP